MKKLIVLLILSVFAFNAYSQQGVSSFKYEVRVPSIRIGGDTKAKLDSIVCSADTIKFYSGSVKLMTEDAAVWSGTSIGLNPTTARISLGATTIGSNLFTLPNPNAIRYLRTNDDNTISARTSDELKNDLALTASDVGLGNVTNESKITMFTNPTFDGTTYINGILMPHASSMAKYIGGSSGNGWDRLFFNNNGLIQWGSGTYMYGDNNKISINRDLDFLYNTNILTGGNIGENTRRVNYIYADTVYANYVQFPSPRYASVSRPTFEDWIRVPNVEAVSNTASLGTVTDPFGSLRLSGSGGIYFGNTFSIVTIGGFPIFTASRFHFSNNITTDHDIGVSSQPVNRGVFRYLETINRPVLGGETAATMNDIGDSLDVMRSDAVYGVALADSNLYNGGYQTPRVVDAKVRSAMKDPLVHGLRAMGNDIIALPLAHSVLNSTTITLSDRNTFFVAFYLPEQTVLTGVAFIVSRTGDFTAADFNGVALYTVNEDTATVAALSANDGDIWRQAQYTRVSVQFTSPYTAAAGIYYVGIMYNQSAETTAPMIYASADIGTAHYSMDRLNRRLCAMSNRTAFANESISGLGYTTDVPDIWLY